MGKNFNYLTVDEFIEIFENPIKNKKRINKIKKISSKIKLLGNGATYEQGYDNYVIEGAKLEALKNAQKNAKEQNFTCEFLEGFTLEQAVIASSKINGWVEEIQSARKPNGEPLTPFEKVVYAMEICTEFYYNMEEKGADPRLSRNINHVLTGDKIVCQGYANLMTKILTGLGIGCETLHLPNTNPSRLGHATCLVCLRDPIYEIDGFFVCEPTWASRRKELNGAKNKLNAYVFLTIEKAKRYYKASNYLIEEDELKRAKEVALSILEPELARLKNDFVRQQHDEYHPKNIQAKFNAEAEAEFEKIKPLLIEALAKARKEIPTPTKSEGELYLIQIAALTETLSKMAKKAFKKSEDELMYFAERCCEQDTDENIILRVKSKINNLYGLFEDEPEQPYGTEQDKIKFKEMLNHDAHLPGLENFRFVAITSVSTARNMTQAESMAHAAALAENLDAEKEAFIANYLAENGESENNLSTALQMVKEMSHVTLTT